MSGPGTSRKRQRIDEDNPEAHSSMVLRRSSRLYFPDGNIIIKTSIPPDAPADVYQVTSSDQSPQKSSWALLYRVHTGVLGGQCGFFSSLFGGSQEAFGHASDRHDGVPIMELPGDDWQAIDDFLKAMYIPNYLSHHSSPLYERDGNGSIELLGRVLTLAKKYEALEIRALAVHLIETRWPSELPLWDRDRNARHLHLDPARAINIGNTHDIHSVLPVAFYEVHVAPKSRMGNFCVDHAEPDLDLLSAEDLRRLVKGGAAFDAECRTTLVRFERPGELTSDCKEDRSICQASLNDWFQKFKRLGSMSYECQMARPFLYLHLIEEHELPGLCKPCRLNVNRRAKIERARLWRDLPKAFDLADLVGKQWGLERLKVHQP